MPWPSLVVPTPGTVITAAWESAMVNDPLLWLRLMTGNADPPGNDYVVVSQGVGSTAWGKVSANVLGPGAVVGHLGYTPANKAGETFTGLVTVPWYLTLAKLDDSGNGGRVQFAPSSGQVGLAIDATNNVMRVYNTSGAVTRMIQFALTSGDLTLPAALLLAALDNATTGHIQGFGAGGTYGYTIDATSSVFRIYNTSLPQFALTFGLVSNVLQVGGQTVWHTGNDGVNSGLDADLWRGLTPAQTTVGGATNAGNASTVSGYAVGNATNQVPISNGVACAGLIAADAGALGGRTPTATPTANAIPLADAAGKLDAWVTPTSAAPVPSGLIAFIADASLPTGWAFYTAMNGRLLVGAGSAGVSGEPGGGFSVGTNYPTSSPNWSHLHASNSFGVSVSVSVSGSAVGGPEDNTGGPSAVNGLAAAGGVNLPTDTHSHSLNGVSFAMSGTGSGSGSATGNTTNVTWIPPSHALNAIRKT